MEKRIIVKENEKMVIVILRGAYGIEAKGISKCHVDDNFDSELGTKIAYNRAIVKYYSKLSKAADCAISHDEEWAKFWTERTEKSKQLKEMADKRLADVTAAYNQLIETIA
jgi:hypothetical protein